MSCLTTVKIICDPDHARLSDVAAWLIEKQKMGHIIVATTEFGIDLSTMKIWVDVICRFVDPRAAMEFKLTFG